MKNQEIAEIFYDIADYLEMDGVAFKPYAYQKVALVLETMEEVVMATLSKNEDVTLAGFGSFEPKTRKGRQGVNPRNVREKIVIPPVRVAKFRAGKNLKEAMKK